VRPQSWQKTNDRDSLTNTQLKRTRPISPGPFVTCRILSALMTQCDQRVYRRSSGAVQNRNDQSLWENEVMTSSEPARHLLLWDGDCSFCGNAAAWIRTHDLLGRITIIPYQECSAPPMTPALYMECGRAVHVIANDGAVLSGARAVLFLLIEIETWMWPARIMSHRPLIHLAEFGYRIVANNRDQFSRFMFRASKCSSCAKKSG